MGQVLVLGSSGFIGRNLVTHLRRTGFPVSETLLPYLILELILTSAGPGRWWIDGLKLIRCNCC